MMPLIGANATISPEDLKYSTTSVTDQTGNDYTTKDGTFTFDDTTIEITTVNSSWTQVNLNNTMMFEVYQSDESFKAVLSQIVTLEPLETKLIVSFEMYSFEFANTSMIINLPTGIKITVMYGSIGDWTFRINDFTILWQEDIRSLDVFNTDFHVKVAEYGDYYHVLVNYFGLIFDLYCVDTRTWIINFVFIYSVTALYEPPSDTGLLDVVYQKEEEPEIPVFSDFPVYPNLEWYDGEYLTIAFIESVLVIASDVYVISIYEDKIVLDYDFVTIIIYMTTVIERFIIMFYEYTIIYYFTIVELIFVIIWQNIEIKVYYYQIVVVYQIFEIIILIYELHFEVSIVIHLDLWIIEIMFLIVILNPVIIQPVIIRFIPIITPILVPLYFFIPVYITQTTYIYLPYLAEQVIIDVYYELLENPTHTIQYFVYDQAKKPIDDATVSVSYNSSIYSTTNLGSGIYEVHLPASDEAEVISVTATKPYYPSGQLIYTLEVNWTSSEIPTVESPLTLLPIIFGIVVLAIGVIIRPIKKRS